MGHYYSSPSKLSSLYFTFISERFFPLEKNSELAIVFQNLKNAVPVSLASIFLFAKSFVSFGMDLFGIILIGVNWAFWIWRVLFFFVHRCFQPLFLYIYFSWSQFFSSSLDSDGLSIRHECYCPLGARSLRIFFTVLFRLDYLHWSIFKFTDFLFCHFQSSIEPIQHIFLFWVFVNFYFFLYLLLFFPWDFWFFHSFQSAYDDHWSICIVAAVKSLLDNSNICVISALASVVFSCVSWDFSVSLYVYFTFDTLNIILGNAGPYLNPVEYENV